MNSRSAVQPQLSPSKANVPCLETVAVNLFSPRELYQVALHYICDEHSGFFVGITDKKLPHKLGHTPRGKAEIIIIDKELLTNDWSTALDDILSGADNIVRVLFICDSINAPALQTILSHKASGYILTSASVEEFRQALRVVAAGGIWLGHDLAYFSMHRPIELKEEKSSPIPSVIRVLSERETQILNQIASGKTSKNIAHELSLSESSVRTYWYRVLNKLNALNTAEAIAHAARLGLLGYKR